MENSPETVFRKTDNFVETEVDNEVVLMNLDNGQFYSLSDTGRSVWQALVDPMSLTAVVDRLTSEYDVPPERCRTEVKFLFDDLIERKFIASSGS